MSNAIHIAAEANTLAPAYSELLKLGFSVTQIPGRQTASFILRAERPGLVLEAEDTLQLLGLATLAERRHANWKPTDSEVDAFLRLGAQL